MDELLQQIERLAAANQALTQRLDREHSMRLAAETDRDQWKSAAMMHTAGKVSAWSERDELERRAHESEAALEALRADVERDARPAISPEDAREFLRLMVQHDFDMRLRYSDTAVRVGEAINSHAAKAGGGT